MEIYNGKDIEFNLKKLGLNCEFMNYNITPTNTIYYFKVDVMGFTIQRLKTAILRLGLFMGEELAYGLTMNGFSLKIRNEERVFPSFNDYYYSIDEEKGEFLLGIDDDGTVQKLKLDDCPHLLVSGQTGSGKSVFLNTLIASLSCCNKPTTVSLMLIDLKKVEMSQWKENNHLCCPIITELGDAVAYLETMVAEMEHRYEVLEFCHKVKDDSGLFTKIVIVIDELADLLLQGGSKVRDLIVRLAQKSRACGIHLVLATQRPSVDVVCGLIKANVPTRICFSVASATDSRVILGHNGAEKLLGKGDCICQLANGNEIHLQAFNVNEQQIYNMLH